MKSSDLKRKSGFRTNSLLLRMTAVLSVLLVLILCTVYIVFNRYYIRNFRENSINFNGKYMETLQFAAEDRLQKLSDQMLLFFENHEVNHYVVAGRGYDQNELISTSLALDKWTDAEDIVSDAALLVLESGVVIQDDNTVSGWDVYADKNRFSDFTTAEGALPSLPYIMGGDFHAVAAMQDGKLRIAVGYPEEMPVAALSVTIDPNRLYAWFAKNDIYPLAWPLAVYDGREEPLFPGLLEYPTFTSTDLILEEDTGTSQCYRLPDQPRTLVMRLYSPELDWFFISCAPDRTIQPPGLSVLKTVFPLLMFLLVMIAAVSLLLVFQIYPPFLRLIHTVEKESREKEQLQKLVQATEEEIAEKLIGMVASGDEGSDKEWTKILERMNHPFTKSGKYVLFLYRCQPLSAPEGSPSLSLNIFEARRQVAGFWVGRCDFEPFSLDDMTRGAVLRYPEQARSSRIKQDLTLFETTMSQKKNTSWRLAWGWGEIVPSISQLGSTRQEAEQALERRLYYAGHSEPEDAEGSAAVLKISRPFSTCLDRLAAGIPEAKEEFRSLKQDTLQLPPEELQEVSHYLYNIVLERLVALQADEQQLEKLREQESATSNDPVAFVSLLFDYAYQVLKDSGRREQYRFVERARDYIQAHYTDSMLSLEMVSSNLGISGPYLSTLMTRYLSMGFGEYVNRYRLDQAKRLLERSDISVQEIGRMTGFNSPQSFGRVFKKYTEETPGKYRERKQREQEQLHE